MNKAQFKKEMQKHLNKSSREVEHFFKAFYKIMQEKLALGQDIKFSGFGTFKSKLRKDKVGRNPRTGEKIIIKATRTVVFKPSKALKEAVKKSKISK